MSRDIELRSVEAPTQRWRHEKALRKQSQIIELNIEARVDDTVVDLKIWDKQHRRRNTIGLFENRKKRIYDININNIC